jgi:hypothetical protein
LARPGAFTIVFVLALPLMLVFYHRRRLPGLAGCDRAKYICSSCSLCLLPGNGQCFILLPFVCRISAGSCNSSSFKYEDGRAHDRLLGGLPSPDFDATTCLSRYEKSKRWKPSPFPVSPYLVEKLRQYEANHRRCGPDTANYREAMAQLMSGQNAEHAEKSELNHLKKPVPNMHLV